jgi:hypothetical protein
LRGIVTIFYHIPRVLVLCPPPWFRTGSQKLESQGARA